MEIRKLLDTVSKLFKTKKQSSSTPMNKKQSSQSANTSTPQDYTRHSPGIQLAQERS